MGLSDQFSKVGRSIKSFSNGLADEARTIGAAVIGLSAVPLGMAFRGVAAFRGEQFAGDFADQMARTHGLHLAKAVLGDDGSDLGLGQLASRLGLDDMSLGYENLSRTVDKKVPYGTSCTLAPNVPCPKIL